MEKVKVILIRNPFDAINSREIQEFEAGKTVGYYMLSCIKVPVQGIEFTVSINGTVFNDVDYRDIILSSGDSLIFCAVPKGGDGNKNPLATIAMIAVTIVAMYFSAGAGGVFAAGSWQAAAAGAVIMVAGGLLVNAIFPPSLPGFDGTKDGSDSRTYGWNPQGNIMSLGASLPVIYGKHKIVPPLLSRYIETVNNKQYLNLLFVIAGHAVESIYDIKIDNQSIDNFTDVEYDIRRGNVIQDAIPYFSDLRFDEVHGDAFNKEAATWITKNTIREVNGFRVCLLAPKGIWKANKEGGFDNYNLHIEAEYRKITTPESDWVKWVGQNDTIVSDSFLSRENEKVFTVSGNTFQPYAATNNVSDIDESMIPEEIDYTRIMEIVPYVDGVAQSGNYRVLDVKVKKNLVSSGGIENNQGVIVNHKLEVFYTTKITLFTSSDDLPVNMDGFAAKVPLILTSNDPSPTRWILEYNNEEEEEAFQYEFQFRFKEGDLPNASTKFGSDLIIEYHQEVINQILSYPKTSLLGIRALATEQLSNNQPVVSCMVRRELDWDQELKNKNIYFKDGGLDGWVSVDNKFELKTDRVRKGTHSIGITDDVAFGTLLGTYPVNTEFLNQTVLGVSGWFNMRSKATIAFVFIDEDDNEFFRFTPNYSKNDDYARKSVKIEGHRGDNLGNKDEENPVSTMVRLADGDIDNFWFYFQATFDYERYKQVQGSVGAEVDLRFVGKPKKVWFVSSSTQYTIPLWIPNDKKLKQINIINVNPENNNANFRIDDMTINYMHVNVYGKPLTNPAWVCAHMLADENNGGNVSSDKINLSSFEDWAGKCDDNNLDCNIYFDGTSNLKTALDRIGMLGRGQVIQLGSRFDCIYDFPVEAVQKFSFGMGNIEENSFQEEWLPVQDRANEIEVTYWDKDDDYNRHIVTLFSDEDETHKENIKQSITLYGCTNRDMATRHANLLLKKNKYLTLTGSWVADVDAIGCRVGDVVDVSHDVPQWGFSGRILNVIDLETQIKIVFDRELDIEAEEDYCLDVRFNDDDTREVQELIGYEAQITDELVFDKVSWDKLPVKDSVYIFGVLNEHVKSFRVLNITKDSELKRRVQAIEYDPDVYIDDAEVTPINISTLGNIQSLKADEIWKMDANGQVVSGVNLSWKGAGGKFSIFYRMKFKLSGFEHWTQWFYLATTDESNYFVKDVTWHYMSTYEFLIRRIS